MSAFVGISPNLDTADLKSLIEAPTIKPSYYFLRWTHKVSGMMTSLPPDFPSPAGQMFNSDYEIRWKQKGKDNYEALLLSNLPLSDFPRDFANFKPLIEQSEIKWETATRNAYFYPKYPKPATRFPHGFDYPQDLNIAQRYFKDKTTSIVHFVALTINSRKS